MRPTSWASWSPTPWQRLGALCLCVVSVAWTTYDRDWNFDSLAYAGAARAWLGESSDALHANVYADLARSAPPEARRELVEASAYRKTLSRHPDEFASQIPLYRNKPLYVGLLALLVALGESSVEGGFWISSTAFGALVYLVIDVLLRTTTARRAWLVTIALLVLPPIREAGRMATPDALCAVFGFAAVRAIILGSSEWAGALLLLAVLTRPDMILFALAVLAWLAKWQPDKRRRLAAWAAIATMTTCFETAALGYPWSGVFVHSFVKRLTSTNQFAFAHVTAWQYFASLLRGLRNDFVLHPSAYWVFLLVSLLGFARLRDRRRQLFASAHILIWASFTAHVALFPMVADRFFLAQYLSIVVTAAMSLTYPTKPAV